jgi:myo-inositol 2-dehydrogenase/D-chiro-inositol 1-dehydrogenase
VPDQHQPPRCLYGYDQRFEVLGSLGMLQAGNHRPTEVTAYGGQHVNTICRNTFRTLPCRLRTEMAHFFDVVQRGLTPRTTVEDGVKALELADAARSWQENRLISL